MHVLDAHTGQQYDADLASLHDLDALKAWLAETAGISAAQQILLTSAGKQVKLQGLHDGVRAEIRRVVELPLTRMSSGRGISL